MFLQAQKEHTNHFSRRSPPITSAGIKVVIIIAVFDVLSTIAVALRFYCRKMRRLSFALDDYMVLGALVTFQRLSRSGEY